MKGLKINPKKAYGDCTGPLGFPMASGVAKEVEQILKDLPDDCREIKTDVQMPDGSIQTVEGYGRALKVPSKVNLEKDERADISLITSDAVDRDREVMYPKGGNFKQFRKNPVVTFAHDYGSLPVGRSLWVKRVKPEGGKGADGWLAKTRYTSKPGDWPEAWFPDAVWHFVQTGDLPGKSIGFIPMEVRKPNEDEVKNRPELAEVSFVIPKWLALEYAVAPVQSNPEALVQNVAKAKSKGVTVPDQLLEAFGLYLCEEPETLTPEEMKGLLEQDEDTGPAKLSPAETRSLVAREIRKHMKDIDIVSMVKEAIDLARGKV